MKKLLLALTALLILLLFSCDRFDHDFTKSVVQVQTPEEFMGNFNTDLGSLTGPPNDNVLQKYYLPGYLNYGRDYSGIKQYFADLFTTHQGLMLTSSFTMENGTDRSSYRGIFRLVGTVDTTSVVDVSWQEDIISDPETGLLHFCGNGQGDQYRRKVLVEVATGTWCVNCPDADEALNHLKSQYPNDMIIVQYQMAPAALHLDNNQLFSWYGISSAPVAVFDGMDKHAGWDESVTAQNYLNSLNAQIGEAAHVLLEPTITNTGTHVEGSVVLTDNGLANWDNCVLKYALLEEQIDAYHDHSGNPLTDTVIGHGSIPVSGPGSYNFTLDPYSPLPYTPGSDLKVVMWVQRVNPTWSGDCTVYNSCEIELGGK